MQFLWVADLQDNLEKAASAKFECLGEVNENNVQGQLLFSSLFLVLAEGEHVY